MTADEVKAILTMLQVEYPQSYSKLDSEQMLVKVNLWKSEFEKDSKDLVYNAVRAYMRNDTSGFAPTIGQVREQMQNMTERNELTEQQAWALVSRACENGIYNYQKEFEKLPLEIQYTVGRPEQLKEWAIMDVETFQSVIASHFRRAYRITLKRKRELGFLPENLRPGVSGNGDLHLIEG